MTAGESAEHTAPYLSTIADAILSLDDSSQEYELQPSIPVIKGQD